MKKRSLLIGVVIVFTFSLSAISSAHAQAPALPDLTSITALINKQHPLPASYVPADLEAPSALTANLPSDSESELRRAAAQHLSTMFAAEANALGTLLVLSSGYRGYNSQNDLYEAANQAIGPSALEVVAPAGMSEHQTGLAADIMLQSRFCAAQACFAMTRAANWLETNSYKYGFILRYPNNERSNTGYYYEPWHYRYVGIDLAYKLHMSRQTLEQYYSHQISSLTP